MHHYPHHIGDYRTHTAHLTMIEDGAYRRMLDIYYMHERPLPSDVAAVQRLVSARTKEEKAAAEAVLLEFFILEADGWHQSRADEEIAAYQERADSARQNGKNGGRPPKAGKKPKPARPNNPDGTQAKPTGNRPGYSWVSESPHFDNPAETQSEPSGKLTGNHKKELGAPPNGAPPDEPQKSSPVAAREEGAVRAPAHDIIARTTNKLRVS